MNVRESFEVWYSDEGSSPKAVERNSCDGYVLIAAQMAWNAWKAACAWQRVRDCGAIDMIDDGDAPEYRACQEAILDQKTE